MMMERAGDLDVRKKVPLSSASKHVKTCSVELCHGVAFANIGLPTSALMGQNCGDHTKALTKMTKELFEEFSFLIGICFSECGECQTGYNAEAKVIFEGAIAAGFGEAHAGFPVFFHTEPVDHCISAFRSCVEVVDRNRVSSLYRHQEWRYAQRLDVVYSDGASEHVIRIYNNHQPSSEKRQFKQPARLAVPQSIVRDAVRDNVDGMICGGDMNEGKAALSAALRDDYSWMVHFQGSAEFVCSTHQAAKDSSFQIADGDIAFGMGVVLMQVDCKVSNILKQKDVHGIVVAAWMRPEGFSSSKARRVTENSSVDDAKVLQSTEKSSVDNSKVLQSTEESAADDVSADEHMYDWTHEEAQQRLDGKDPDNADDQEEPTNKDWDGCDFLLWMNDIMPSVGPKNCLTVGAISSSKHLMALTKDQKDQFQVFADTVLTGSYKKSVVPAGHLVRARNFADPKQIIQKMQTIMTRRRSAEPDDRKKLSKDQRTKFYSAAQS